MRKIAKIFEIAQFRHISIAEKLVFAPLSSTLITQTTHSQHVIFGDAGSHSEARRSAPSSRHERDTKGSPARSAGKPAITTQRVQHAERRKPRSCLAYDHRPRWTAPLTLAARIARRRLGRRLINSSPPPALREPTPRAFCLLVGTLKSRIL